MTNKDLANLIFPNITKTVEDYEKEFGLPAADMYHDGAAKILDAILEHLGKN